LWQEYKRISGQGITHAVRGSFACAVLLLLCLGVAPSYAEKRVALVVGNNVYPNLPRDQQLQKAVNDARAVGDALGKIGFAVIRGENLGRQVLVDKLDQLGNPLRGRKLEEPALARLQLKPRSPYKPPPAAPQLQFL
jgi:hypothetical protein